MLRASFPPVKCAKGHFHAYTDDECPMCHDATDRADEKLFCKSCKMVRPSILETFPTKMTVHESKFCFWCGESLAVIEKPLFAY